MTALEHIKDFAEKAHGDQMRKYTPEPYIVHPVRVMKLCEAYTDDVCMLAAALLHDVLEDTEVSGKTISGFLLPLIGRSNTLKTMRLVTELTDVYVKKDYPQYNRKKRKQLEKERMATISADAQTIKYADIMDNCMEIVTHDRHFASLYLKECRSLLNVMTSGNPVLYETVKHAVDQHLHTLLQNKSS